MNAAATPTTARLALAAVALMASLPFLVPVHTTPIPSFHAEWLAAVLGLGGIVALIGAHGLPLPGAALLALGLATIALAQRSLGHAPVPPLADLFALYLLWAALLASAGRSLAESWGRERLARTLAVAIFAGAMLAGLLGFVQPWLKGLGWTGYALPVGGPLGQANHLNVYLWLGLASALYLRTAGKLSGVAFWTTVCVLTFASVSAGQRSSFLYATALIAIAFWQRRPANAGEAADGRRLAFRIGALFVLMQPLPGLLPASGGDVRPPPALRAMQQFEGPSIRWQLLRLGIEGIADAPLTGGGIGSYAGLAYAKADVIAPEQNPGPAEHAHNLLVDLAVELGLPAALLVAGAGLYWLRRLPLRTAPADAGWAAAVAAMLGLHGMIEYPLWHAYFLGLLAIVAGAFGGGRQVGSRAGAAVLATALVAYGAWTLHDLRRDYARLERALGANDKAALIGIPRTSLLAPWVQTTACVSLDPLDVPLADGLAVCKAAMAFAPTPESGISTVALLWRDGNVKAAAEAYRRIRLGSYHDLGKSDARHGSLTVREPRLATIFGTTSDRGP